MNSRETGSFLWLSVGLVALVLLMFGILQWLQIPSGTFLDWLMGAMSFWWLLIIVTVPWNIHFGAKAVLAEATQSQRQGITVEAQPLHYVEQIARRSLWVALLLHGLSALVLYGLSDQLSTQFGQSRWFAGYATTYLNGSATRPDATGRCPRRPESNQSGRP